MTQAEASTQGRAGDSEVPLNPYIGPRPFTTQERGRFYGREQEASQLLSLVIAERLVLFYAQSGAGKSSLINARLIPGLEERNFKVLSGRVSGETTESIQAANIFTYNLLQSLESTRAREQGAAPRPLDTLSLCEYFSGLEVEIVSPTEAAGAGENGNHPDSQMLLDAPQIFSGVRPLTLIIDQFEEIFTTSPGAWSQRGPFFEQLREAMQQDPYLWVVLVMREDYVAALDPFANLLPGRLRARFYMQRMGFEAAAEAVRKPVESIRPFESEAVRELVTNLRLIMTGKDADGRPVYEPGQYVEPVQLQVVCYQLWEELRRSPGQTITVENLQQLTAGKDLASFISDALALFYRNAIQEVCAAFPATSERKVREWFSRECITEAETRGAVIAGKERTGSPPTDLPNAVVLALQDHFIIRAEIRGENTWYELSHDRFVAPILQENRRWSEQNSLPVEAAAQNWVEAGSDKLLYDGRQLAEAIQLLNTKPDELSETAKGFIRRSQEVSRSRERKRQRIAFGVLSSLLFLALVLAILAVNNASIAGQQRRTAEAASTKAIQQQALAETASTAVVQQREIALQQKSTAEVASTKAIQQQAVAENASTLAVQQQQTAEVASTAAIQQEMIAKTAEADAMAANIKSQASRLASLADFFRVSQPDLSMLLAIRSVDIYDSRESRRALLESIQSGLQTQVQPEGFSWFIDDYPPNSVALSPDGRFLAAGMADGSVVLQAVDQRSISRRLPETFAFKSPVNSLSFNSAGDLLAIAGIDRRVILWQLGETPGQDEITSFPAFPVTGAFYPIRTVAIQPGGQYIAVTTDQDLVNQVAGKLMLFDLQNLEAGAQFTQECRQANCLPAAWSPDGARLAYGDSQGNIKIYDVTSSPPAVFWTKEKAHSDQVRALVFYPDNQHMVSGGLDLRLYEWDTGALGSTPVRESRREDTPPVFSIAMDPSGRYLVVGGNDTQNMITVWDADTLERKIFPGLNNPHTQPVQSVAFSAQGTRFASASSDQFIKVWSFQPIDPLSTLAWTADAPGRSQAVGLTPDGQVIAAKTTTDGVTLWQKDRAEPLLELDKLYKAVAMQMVDGKPVLLLGGADGQVEALDAVSGQALAGPLAVAPGKNLRALAASSDLGQMAAVACSGSGGSCAEIYLAAADGSAAPAVTGLELANNELINAITFRPDGAVLAAGTSQGRILLLDTATNQVIGEAATEGIRLSTAQLSISSLGYSPREAGLLVAGLYDGRVALWEAATGDPIGVFDERMTVPEIPGLAFYHDPEKGWLMYSIGALGEVRQWEIDRDAWMRRGCQKLSSSRVALDARASLLYPNTTVEGLCK